MTLSTQSVTINQKLQITVLKERVNRTGNGNFEHRNPPFLAEHDSVIFESKITLIAKYSTLKKRRDIFNAVSATTFIR